MVAAERAALSLAELEAFDPQAPQGGRERRFCCPLPACERKPRDASHRCLCVNVETGAWLCNRCGATGKLTEHWETGKDITRFRGAAARRVFALPPEPQAGSAASAPLLPGMLAACRPVVGTPGERYLTGRGLPIDVAADAGVLFSRDWYGRPAVVFPLRDQQGEIVAANGRHMDGRSDPKTHTVGDLRLGTFATPGAYDTNKIVLVEGPADALALASIDVPAVALVRTRAPHWLPRAVAFKTVLIGLDADATGDAHAKLLREQLVPFARSVRRLRPPEAPPYIKDWADVLAQRDPEALRLAVAAADHAGTRTARW